MELMNNWGISTQVDLKNCDPDLIKSREFIQDYVIQLCKLIEMKRFGDVTFAHFDEEDKYCGYSISQFIENSLISAHFITTNNAAYIDILSCKTFNPALIAEFTKEFFKSSECDYKVSLRK